MDANPNPCANMDACAYVYTFANGITDTYSHSHTIADTRAYGHTIANNCTYCYARARRTYTYIKAIKLG